MNPKPDRMAFGHRVLQARLELGARQHPPRTITQEEIGKAMGMTGVAIGQWEAGKSKPNSDKLLRLATILGVRAGWLAWGEEPMRYGQAPTDNDHEKQA